jgi:hypothetical protein
MLIVFTGILGWVAVNLTNLPGMKSDISTLLSRPVGITQDQYIRDEARRDRELEELRQEWREWRENHGK